MLKYENEGLAHFEVDCILWTNSQLSALAKKAFPKDLGAGGIQLDETLKALAHKIQVCRDSSVLSVRIAAGFELAVFKVLLQNGLSLQNRSIAYDPGGAIVGPADI